jgi:DNA polymerase III delta subunit
MIYLFYGPGQYLRQKKLNAIISATLQKKPQTAFKKFSLDEEEELNQLYDFIVPRSLFESAKRVAIVKNSDLVLDEDIFKRVVILLGADKESALFFNEGWEKNEVPKILQPLLEGGSIKEFYFESISESKIRALLSKEIREKGIKTDLPALNHLISVFNGDIYACLNELEKLSLLNVPITKKLLLSMDEYQEESQIFEFSRAVSFNASLGEKLSLWERLSHQRVDGYIVLNYLAKAAGNLPLIKKIADADVSVKTGRLDPEQAILAMLLG